jgi:hypothetical protein
MIESGAADLSAQRQPGAIPHNDWLQGNENLHGRTSPRHSLQQGRKEWQRKLQPRIQPTFTARLHSWCVAVFRSAQIERRVNLAATRPSVRGRDWRHSGEDYEVSQALVLASSFSN